MKQREIKFNVYNNNTGKIIQSDDCEIRFFGSYFYRVYINGKEVCNDKSSILLQFTGLHDKNGKEIYEGDIVKYKLEDEKEQIIDIIFEEGSFVGRNGEPNNQVEYLTDFEYTEVIGNIHENKDLLKGDKIND